VLVLIVMIGGGRWLMVRKRRHSADASGVDAIATGRSGAETAGQRGFAAAEKVFRQGLADARQSWATRTLIRWRS